MKNSDTVKKIISYLKRYIPHAATSLILAAISVVLTLYVPILIGNTIDLIVCKGNVNMAKIVQILLKASAIIVATGVVNWLMNILNNTIVYGTVKDIRKRAFDHMQNLPISFSDTHAYGDIVSRVISDTDTFADGLLMAFNQFFTGIMTILVTIIFMISINLKTALMVIVLTPLSLLVSKFITSKTYSMFKLQSEIRGAQTAHIQESVTNQKVVQAFSHGKETLEKFDEINEKLEKCSLKATFFSSLVNPSTRFINNIIYLLVALLGSFLTIGNTLTIGGLSCLLSYANQYTKPFNEISGVIAELQNAVACAARIFELIEAPVQSKDGFKEISPENISGNIEAKNVSFSYSKDKKLIENLNFSVKPGMQIAIVGPTGCGKTTLINLLMRFYDITGGEISVDGENINDLTRSSLRRSFGMVLQDTWLRSGTIRENIATAKPNASDEEIISAAKSAHAHSFIRRLPKGYDTVITSNGGGLSQGEKQLLCIARLMLCPPPMLILDEATSSIDTRTEIKIQSAFKTLMKGRTSFIVAHRLSTVKGADLILVMKDGDIVEQGTHEQLMEKGGFYHKIYDSQFTN